MRIQHWFFRGKMPKLKYRPRKPSPCFFFQISLRLQVLQYRHHDNPFNDFALQRLLPQKYSQLGPFITTGDINNDGATDLFIGGGFNFSGKIFTQKTGWTFISKNLTDSIKLEEDMDCVLFDADKDGDLICLLPVVICNMRRIPFIINRGYTITMEKAISTCKLNAIPDPVITIAGCVSCRGL